MTKKIKILAAAGALSAVTIVPVSAQFFGGMPVIDAGNLAEAVVHTAKWGQQIKASVDIYNEAAKTFNRVTDHYNHVLRQALYIKNQAVRYRSPGTPWRGITATDSTGQGTNIRWLTAVNGGLGALDGWEKSVENWSLKVEDLKRSGVILSERQKKEIAAIEIQDGAGVVAMETLGSIRSNGVRTEPMLRDLENDSLSDDPEKNTSADLAKRANAISILQARQATDQNKLLANSVELALIRERREREAVAYAIAAEADRQTEGRAILQSMRGCASSAMMSFNPRKAGSSSCY